MDEQKRWHDPESSWAYFKLKKKKTRDIVDGNDLVGDYHICKLF